MSLEFRKIFNINACHAKTTPTKRPLRLTSVEIFYFSDNNKIGSRRMFFMFEVSNNISLCSRIHLKIFFQHLLIFECCSQLYVQHIYTQKFEIFQNFVILTETLLDLSSLLFHVWGIKQHLFVFKNLSKKFFSTFVNFWLKIFQVPK